MTSQMVAWMLSGIWLVAIVLLYHAAHAQFRALREQDDLLLDRYKGGKQKPYEDSQKYLHERGWENSSALSRQDIVAHWRALAQTDKQKLATFIEMMPQMGLLGTVLSLFLSAFIFEFTMKMLGLALATTGFGLVGSLLARQFLEMPSEKHYHSILELLNDEGVVQRLIQEPKPVDVEELASERDDEVDSTKVEGEQNDQV